MRAFLDLLHRFRKDERGAFAAMFAVIGIVLIATAGAVVDYTSVEQARTRAQVALDAAALALQPSIYTQDTTWLKTKAQAVLTERIADSRITATVQTVTKNTTTGEIYMTASVNVPLSFVALIGINQMNANIKSKAIQGSKDLEVGLALDITYSMNGTKIADLQDATNDLIDLVIKDTQTPTYSKMAIVPYSNAVNVGTYAASARGPEVTSTSVTAASWLGAGKNLIISGVTKANPTRITTSTSHGLATGATVYITNAAGGGFTALNNRSFTITYVSATQFTLNGNNSSSYSGSYTASSGDVTTDTMRTVSSINKANPATFTTGVAHGLTSGDAIYFTSAAGGGFTALNNREFQVTVTSTTAFTIKDENGANVSTSGYTGSYTAGSGLFTKCQTNECEVVVTSANHGNTENGIARMSGFGGMTQVNSNLYQLTDVTTNTFVLENTNGYSVSTYTSGGTAQCADGTRGCTYYYYQNTDGDMILSTISNCVTERIGTNQYTDAAPSTTYVGRNYPNPDSSSLGLCPGEQIEPLTANKTTLHTIVNALTVEGSTAGQIGLAWAWYSVSPNFSYLWPAASQKPAAYGTDNLLKVVILMTDGAFNTGYCNGVISQNYGLGAFWGSDEGRINCDATNGNPFDQADSLCTAIKDAGVILYTVAFDLGSDQDAIDLMADCASGPSYAFAADDGTELGEAFAQIAENISQLRIAS